jgi:hypothetical protein
MTLFTYYYIVELVPIFLLLITYYKIGLESLDYLIGRGIVIVV